MGVYGQLSTNMAGSTSGGGGNASGGTSTVKDPVTVKPAEPKDPPPDAEFDTSPMDAMPIEKIRPQPIDIAPDEPQPIDNTSGNDSSSEPGSFLQFDSTDEGESEEPELGSLEFALEEDMTPGGFSAVEGDAGGFDYEGGSPVTAEDPDDYTASLPSDQADDVLTLFGERFDLGGDWDAMEDANAAERDMALQHMFERQADLGNYASGSTVRNVGDIYRGASRDLAQQHEEMRQDRVNQVYELGQLMMGERWNEMDQQQQKEFAEYMADHQEEFEKFLHSLEDGNYESGHPEDADPNRGNFDGQSVINGIPQNRRINLENKYGDDWQALWNDPDEVQYLRDSGNMSKEDYEAWKLWYYGSFEEEGGE